MDWLHVILSCLLIGTCQGLFDASNGGLKYQIVEPDSQALITIVADDTAVISWQHMELDSIVARYANRSLVLLGDRSLYSVSLHVENQTVTMQMKIKVDSKTMGNYRCSYRNDAESKTAYFYVGLNTTMSAVGLGVKNYTECCETAGVSSGCLPVCDAGTLNFKTFKFSVCTSPKDIDGLRKCLMAGRNHVGCCSQRRVQSHCLALCSFLATDPPTANCTEDLDSITQCFYEGKEAIPSPPASLVVQTPTRQSLLLLWSPPRLNAALHTGYSISYKAESEAHWKKILVKKKSLTKKITDVKLNAKYKVKHHDFFYKKTGNVSVSDCCAKKRVGSKCQALLCAGIPRKFVLTDVLSCIKHWHSILECYAGGRNRTNCCLSNGITTSCLKFCSGKSVDTQKNDIVCLAKTAVMTRCFDAGVRTVPSPPTQLTAHAVSFQTISWQWKAPVSLPDKKSDIKYRLSYRNISVADSSPSYVVEIADNVTSFVLTGLTPGATYEAELFAFNAHGSSLESNQVRVATHSGGPVVLPPQQSIHNPAQCCQQKQVATQCRPACDLMKPFSSLPQSCNSSAAKIASCLADGRDHSHCCFTSFNIPTKCQFLCRIKDEKSIPSSDDLWSCMKGAGFADIRRCFAVGLALLPSPPRALELFEVNKQLAKVRWLSPIRRPELLSGYELMIAADGKESINKYNSTVHDASVHLNKNVNYRLRVVAVTKRDRRSLPSNSIVFRSLPNLPPNYASNKRPNFDLDNVTTCCSKKGLTGDCQAMCSTHSNASFLWTSEKVHQCSSKLKTVLECSADNRDHTGCCTQSWVPVFCLGMCKKQVEATHSSSLVCVQFLPEIRSCFLDGYETLPAAPLLQNVRELSHSAVRVTFSEPESNRNFTELNNYLYYKSSSAKFWKVKANVKSPFTLDGLSSLTNYSLFMVAVNDKGTSLPSARFSVTTFANSPFSSYILADPSLNVVAGYSNLRLSCIVSPNGPAATFSWFREGEPLSFKGPELIYPHVTKGVAGQHTCQATLYTRTVTRSVFLAVQHDISVTASALLVRTPLYRSVEVSCTFSGFPKAVFWEANGNRIPSSSTRYLVTNSNNNHYKVSSLRITEVLQSSYGEYKCVGTNDFGSKRRSQTILIKDPSYSGAPPTPSTRPNATNPKQCCATHRVSESCQDACSFNNRTFSPSSPCLPELAFIVPCLADGRNHSLCCAAAGVPSVCFPLCAGLTTNLNAPRLLPCFLPESSDKILKCMEEGVRSLPSEPLFLRVKSQRKDVLVFSWMAPEKNPHKVAGYEVKVVDTLIEQTVRHEVQGQVLHWTMKNPPASHSFIVRVRAKGMAGSGFSQYSVPLRTFSIGPPTPPVNLHAEVMGNVSVKLSWQKSHQSVVPITKFKVFWRLSITKKKDGEEEEMKERMNVTTDPEIVFPCLREKSSYMFEVEAWNSYGKSKKSRRVFANTKENFNPHCKKKIVVTRTKNELGAYVAVVVLVLFLVAGLMSVAVFIQANRHNPNYAWPGWLRRLPGLQSRGQPVATFDFDNPVSFDNSSKSVKLRVDGNTSYA